MRILVTGSSGQLGSEVIACLDERGAMMRPQSAHEVIATTRDTLDVADRDEVMAVVASLQPDVVIHPAAYTAVDACESEVDRAFAVNALGTRNIAEAARLVGAHVAYVSTDYVFDGTSAAPYREWDEPNPRSVYGRSKLAGERSLDASSTIVRTSWLCGRHGANVVKTVLRLARAADGPLRFVDDQHGSPSIASDVAAVLVELAIDRRPGIFHVTNQGATTWFGFAQAVVGFAGGDPSRVEPISTLELIPPRPAPRPANSVLDNAALRLSGIELLPDWHESTAALVAELSR